MTKIKYPEATDWLEYNYDTQNRLSKVVGFTAATDGITYNADNSLASMTYYNGAVVSYGYDSNSRLSSLQASRSGDNILDLDYTYDDNNNITQVNDKDKIKTYVYDENNQLIQAITPDKFLAPTKLNGASTQVAPDFKGASWMDYMQVLPGMMGLDYHAKSIGIDFGVVVPKLKQIKLVPGEGYQNHRITEYTLDLYTSLNNSVYSLVTRDNWEFAKNSETGVITITFSERISTRYLKVHVKFDDRDIDGNARDSTQFLNELAGMMEVYQESDSRTEEYQYDAAGNRKLLKVTLVQTENYYSYYYTNSDRLKTDGKYAFDYDAAGNLIRKGNRYEINGDMVTFTTVGEGVEFWEYEYDLLNRLISVRKNGNIVSEYAYTSEGLRVVKRKFVGGTLNDTTHYVFEGTEPIFEKRISDSRVRSYVFAFGKHLARVDGVIGDASAQKFFYHTDHVGSVRAVSNAQGQVVWKADYLAFGSRYGKEGTFEEERGFTGKEYDPDSGLYYYNARWYDSELGRFICEDPVTDPNNPNIYSYCSSNPLKYNDPTGLDEGDPDDWSWLLDNRGGGGTPGGGGGGSSPPPTPQLKLPGQPGIYNGGQTPPGTNTRITYDKKGNIKSQTVYNPDGTVQYQVNFNKDGTVKSQTSYSSPDQRTITTYRYSKNGVIETNRDQSRESNQWSTDNVYIKGYNNQADLSDDDWNFEIYKDGSLGFDGVFARDLNRRVTINGDLLLESYVTYLRENKVGLGGWKNSYISLWDVAYFTKNENLFFSLGGVVYDAHTFGNIEIGFIGASYGLGPSACCFASLVDGLEQYGFLDSAVAFHVKWR